MSIGVERIRHHWDWVRPAIETLIDETEERVLPEDVFAWCEAGKAMFVLADEGFVVATIDESAVTGEKTLLIWFAYAKHLGGDCVSQYMPYFFDLAKQLGCVYISTKTAIAPVGQHLIDNGWKCGLTEYTLAVR